MYPVLLSCSPVISGFAGAINICQSERDSILSGAAVGVLVAASLAPPIGLMGTGIYMQEWNVVLSSIFKIVLQLLGIHLAATLVFRFYGNVTRSGIRFLKGRKSVQYGATTIVGAALCAMMYWQFSQPTFLQKASMNTELTTALEKVLSQD